MAITTLNAKYLNDKEFEFVNKVAEDVIQFMNEEPYSVKNNVDNSFQTKNKKSSCSILKSSKGIKRAILFPPLTSKGRFLLHKTIEENFPLLKSFSVGHEPSRRTAVTFLRVIQDHKLSKEHEESSSLSLTNILPVKEEHRLLVPLGPAKLNLKESLERSSAAYLSSNNPGDNHCVRNSEIKATTSVNENNAKSSLVISEKLASTIDSASSVANCFKKHEEFRAEIQSSDLDLEKFDSNLQELIKPTDSYSQNFGLPDSSTCSVADGDGRIDIDSPVNCSENSSSKGNSIHSSSKTKHRTDSKYIVANDQIVMSGGIMVSETENFNNLARRSKAQVNIYRPPPARSSKYNRADTQDKDEYFDSLKEFQNNVINNKAPLYDSNVSDPKANSNSKKDQKSRRPDQQLYIPRRRRCNDSPSCSTPILSNDLGRAPSPTNSVCSVSSEYCGPRQKYSSNGRLSSDDDRLYQKPPLFTTKDSSDLEKSRSKAATRFKSETLQLIERCINKEPQSNRTNHGSNFDNKRTSPRDNHPIHCKENMSSADFNPRSKRGRKNRKRGSKSRDSSTDSRVSLRGSSGDQKCYNYGFDRYSASHENLNFRGMNSNAASRASSRNPSLERSNSNDSPIGYEWRRRNNCQTQETPSNSPILNNDTNKYLNYSSDVREDLNTPVSSPASYSSPNLEEQLDSCYISATSETSSTHLSDIAPSQPSGNLTLDNLSESNSSLLNGLEIHSQCSSPSYGYNSLDSSEVTIDLSTPSLRTCDISAIENLSNVEPTSLNDELDSEDLSKSESEVNLEVDTPNPKKFSFNWADQDNDSWDAMYDDSGNCLDSSLTKELKDTVGDIVLTKPTNDYYEFKPAEPKIADESFGHMVEIYDFPASFKTPDLLVIFHDFKNVDMKWVDDTHAIGIFPSVLQARESLDLVHPFVKTRPLSQAIAATKTKALKLSDSRLPYKPRPQTSAALARRLVSGALGLKVRVPKEQRDAEKNKLKRAKDLKRKAAQQKEDAWEGTIANMG